MTQREFVSRLNLIIKKLKTGPATYNEIHAYLEKESEMQGYNFLISRRTFQRDIEHIRSIYHIHIQYNHSHKWYTISNEE